MKKIEIFERAIKEGGRLKDYGINATVFAAYRNLEYTGNEDLDFADTIWDHDIAEIAETLRLQLWLMLAEQILRMTFFQRTKVRLTL